MGCWRGVAVNLQLPKQWQANPFLGVFGLIGPQVEVDVHQLLPVFWGDLATEGAFGFGFIYGGRPFLIRKNLEFVGADDVVFVESMRKFFLAQKMIVDITTIHVRFNAGQRSDTFLGSIARGTPMRTIAGHAVVVDVGEFDGEAWAIDARDAHQHITE